MGAGVSLILLPALGTLPPIGCLVQPLYEDFCLVLLYLVWYCLVNFFLRTLFLKEKEGKWIWKRRDVAFGEREGGSGVGGARVAESSGKSGNCYKDVLYERRIYLQNKSLLFPVCVSCPCQVLCMASVLSASNIGHAHILCLVSALFSTYNLPLYDSFHSNCIIITSILLDLNLNCFMVRTDSLMSEFRLT